jgi:hypothetical protein
MFRLGVEGGERLCSGIRATDDGRISSLLSFSIEGVGSKAGILVLEAPEADVDAGRLRSIVVMYVRVWCDVCTSMV